MYQTNPSLFIFVDAVLKVQTEIYIKCNSVNEIHKFKNIATKKRHNFVNSKIIEYKNNKLSKLQYVKIISHYYAIN